MSKVTTVKEENTTPIFEGGPTQEQIEQWKSKYGNKIYSINIDQELFIWKALSRKDFKELNAMQDAPLVKEERLCQICILWPENYDEEAIQNGLAGAPSILAEHIMETSGFGSISAPVAL